MNTETKLNLQKIIDHYGLDPRVVAQVLFPANRCQLQALRRTVRENIPLDIEQLDALAKYLKLEPAQLLQYGVWSGEVQGNEPVLLLGPLIVKIKPNGCYLRIGDAEKFIANSTVPIGTVISILNKELETWTQSEFKSILISANEQKLFSQSSSEEWQ